jgi:hypothetical protein
MASTGKWLDLDVPKRGWSCAGIDDLGKDRMTCEMCEVQRIRWVHYMEHPNHSQLMVGCICAGYMEENLDAARRREAGFKSRVAKEQRRMVREEQQRAAREEWLRRQAAYDKQQRAAREERLRRQAAYDEQLKRRGVYRADELLGCQDIYDGEAEEEQVPTTPQQRLAALDEWHRTSLEEWRKANPSLCATLTALRRAGECPTLTPWESEFAGDVAERYVRDSELSAKQLEKAQAIIMKAYRYFTTNQ